MTWDQLELKWNEFAGSARAHWSQLTEDDWQSITGNKEDLTERIQVRYGVSEEEAEQQVDDWCGALLEIVEAPRSH